jgi:hypothetical protein
MGLPVVVGTRMVAQHSNLEIKRKGQGWSTYKNGVYCGPGWGYTVQDVLDDKIKNLPEAIDAIDEACKLHDTCYQENGWCTQGCNLVLTANLAKVVVDPKSTPQQRLDATIMAAIFFIESQTVDVPKAATQRVAEGAQWTRQKYDEVYERMVGYLGPSMNTLEQAIIREMMRAH